MLWNIQDGNSHEADKKKLHGRGKKTLSTRAKQLLSILLYADVQSTYGGVRDL